ncbi:beta-ketoacyl-ACP synthase III [Desulfofalx alkaliphila]|uniref:beta-ketoacyl-ACP synthase III n=1 Tax=Desulfofalx alkaliphila TaxID=105483 RepID=UPI0004E1802F|nr:beta-ketoacyl-ACP synthase III [Desulfofalx alkaliphila]
MASQLIQAGIIGVGSYVPNKVLTNNDLEKIVNTSDEWITSRTGIKERRVAEPEQAASDLAFEAGRKALEHAGLPPEEIGLIIVATSTPDMFFPSTACLVQEKLKCVNASAFDLSAACTGFIYALNVGKQFINTGAEKYVLVIGAEVLTRIVNWQDRTTCVLFGDGAGAAVLGPVPQGRGIISSYMAAEGAGASLLTLPGCGSRIPLTPQSVEQGLHFISMKGKEVYKFAVRVMEEGTQRVLQQAGMKVEDLDMYIPHQANIRIIEHAAKKIKLPMEKVLVNVDRYGNTSAASVPLALDEAVKQGKIKSGDNVLLIGFGAGLTCAAVLVRWA